MFPRMGLSRVATALVRARIKEDVTSCTPSEPDFAICYPPGHANMRRWTGISRKSTARDPCYQNGI